MNRKGQEKTSPIATVKRLAYKTTIYASTSNIMMYMYSNLLRFMIARADI
jgi:hypothetical protein